MRLYLAASTISGTELTLFNYKTLRGILSLCFFSFSIDDLTNVAKQNSTHYIILLLRFFLSSLYKDVANAAKSCLDFARSIKWWIFSNMKLVIALILYKKHPQKLCVLHMIVIASSILY